MRFSNKAYKYLSTLKRDEEWTITDRKAVINHFARQGFLIYDKVIDFQMDFSGLELPITNKPSSTFKARLFSNADLKLNSRIDAVKINGRYYFYCGDHEMAQVWFVINNIGQICTYNNDNESVNIIFSTFDKFVETYAFLDLLSKYNKYEHLPYYRLIDNTEFDKFTKNYFNHFTASDEYNHWLSDKNIIIQKGTWYDRSEFFIHIYGDDKEQCESYIMLLRVKQIIA